MIFGAVERTIRRVIPSTEIGLILDDVGLAGGGITLATGDQAMFARREAFARVGGFPEIPLMEDVALSKALKTIGPPLCLREAVTTSSRRWEERGTWRTIVLMWRLRYAYWRGADPGTLAERYR